MSPLRLLFFSFFPLILALPPSVSRQQSSPDLDCDGGNRNCVQKVFLKDGLARVSVNSFFDLSGTDPEKATQPSYEVIEGKDDNIITQVDFGPPSPPDPDHQNIVYNALVTFKGFPGRSSLRIFIQDSEGKNHSETHIFETIGLVMYELKGNQPRILTGLNNNRTNLRPDKVGGFATTVNVSIFEGDPTSTPPRREDIRFVIEEKYAHVLPWNSDDCHVIDVPENLGVLCSMAFTADFKTFSIRVFPGRELRSEIRVRFEWTGIREYQKRLIGEIGVSGGDQPISLEDDFITSIIVEQGRGPDGKLTTDSGPLAGWKIGVIAITSVLLVVAAITLVCCFFCGKKRSLKKPEPDVVGFKDKFQEIGFLRRSTLRRRDDDDDQCYVEEPPTPDDSEILMLENESRGHRRSAESHNEGNIEGLIPMERLKEDKSVERLVLPPGVVRGVELESSTEGASGFGYGSQSREYEGTSYGHIVTSPPRDQFTKSREYRASRDRTSTGSRRSEIERSRDPDYFRDSHERIRSLERDRAHIREIDREIERERSARERSEERMRPLPSAEAFPESRPVIDERTNGMASRSRGGVGAAINRIRQLDLLNGPASRGLVGRNGEPIENANGEGRSGGSVVDISGSALS